MRAAIIVAAGASRRFGHQDKLKALLHGKPLLDHVIAHARASGAGRILLVNNRAERRAGVIPVRARGWRDGLSASLRAGLAALRPIDREVLIFLADMPFAWAPRMRLRGGEDSVRPRFDALPGHPMLVRTSAARAAAPRGDKGLGGALRIRFVRGSSDHVIDVDTPAALRRAHRHGSPALWGRSRPA